MLHPEFPDVHYVDNYGGSGRTRCEFSNVPLYWSTSDADWKWLDYLPVSFAEADYIINFAVLKGHSSGVTLCAKNHYGSLIRCPDGYIRPSDPEQRPGQGSYENYYNIHLSLPNAIWSPGLGHYRSLVDLMGHSELGGKTVLYLIDGLFGGYYWEAHPYKWDMEPFNGDWPSSIFVSQDPVAIDSVCYDFLSEEWPNVVAYGGSGSLQGGAEDYLHEASEANDPVSGTFYDPEDAGTRMESLGIHEHWNNPLDKQYSRNLGTGEGIELVSLVGSEKLEGDLNEDDKVDIEDVALFCMNWLECTDPLTPGCTPLIAATTIGQGTATVDGDLSDWGGAQWIEMKEVYWGDARDISDARWAAKWSPDTNLIYLAVKVVDGEHVFSPSHMGWNQQDEIEVYIDAGNTDHNLYNDYFDYAQEWVVGYNGSGGAWGHLDGHDEGGQPAGSDLPGYAASVDGDTINYEVAINPYYYYRGFGGTEMPQILISLESGITIGLDVLAGSKHSSGFGMLCENMMTGKFKDAGQFLDFLLVEEVGGSSCGDWGYFDADINRDCKVDFRDFCLLSNNWGRSLLFEGE